MSTKLASRPYRYAGEKDILTGSIPLFRWGYLHTGQDLRDPLLSPGFADQGCLPKWIFAISAEYDMLSAELRDFMLGLMGVESAEEKKLEYEKGTYKWVTARAVGHGFLMRLIERGEEERIRAMVANEMIDAVGKWLLEGPFASDS